jgi:GH24 family phage-related lysozyme (muramidase)
MSILTASHGLTLSETGLKLIKAYEGFRPVDRILVNGQRVVGYGHRLFNDNPMHVTKSEAEALLKSDLQAYEDMVNENVHAPLTQGQFDALVSFAYNIGPKAFLESDTLRALNNGRPLDAANGLDIWRKSTINGKTYVVDALMRRRTAEKALFLKTENVPQPAPGADLPPVEDDAIAVLSTEDALPVFTKDEAAGIVATAPFDAQPAQNRRREDGPAGILMLSEVVDENDPFEDELVETARLEETPWIEEDAANKIETDLEPGRTVIAEAAADISERLDALIENVKEETEKEEKEWPESLITTSDEKSEDVKDNLVVFPGADLPTKEDSKEERAQILATPKDEQISSDIIEETETKKEVDLIIDNLLEDDAMRQRSDSAARYIENNPIEYTDPDEGNTGFWMIMLTGFILLGASIAASLRGAEEIMGQWGPVLVLAGLMIGGLMILGAAYYAVRRLFR